MINERILKYYGYSYKEANTIINQLCRQLPFQRSTKIMQHERNGGVYERTTTHRNVSISDAIKLCDEKINHPGHHRLNKELWADLKNRLEKGLK